MKRRQALHACGAALLSATAGCASPFGSSCPPRRTPTWTFGGERWSPPVVRDGRLLVSENYGGTALDRPSRIVCLDLHRGRPQLIYTVERAGAGVPRVAHDDTVYVGTGTDYVYSFDFETGHKRWRYDAGGNERVGGAWGQPVVVSHSQRTDPNPTNGDAYAHRVVALDTNDGTERWARQVDGMVWAGPTRLDDSVVVGTRAGRLHRFDAVSGDRRWSAPLGDAIDAPPLVDDGTVYAVAKNGTAGAFAADSAESRWRVHVSGRTRAAGETDALVVLGADTGTVTALSKATGDRAWQYEASAPIAALDAAGGRVWALTHGGFISQLDAATGSMTRRFRVAETHFEDVCGWVPNYERGVGLAAGEDDVFVTGPWVGAFGVDGR